MTEAEKKLLQAQHRLEEAQARDRVKERKMRTRRLIQEAWNTSDADCSKAPFRFQRYCGSREFRGADAMPAPQEHRVLHLPCLLYTSRCV